MHNKVVNRNQIAIGSEEPKPRLPTGPCIRVTYTALTLNVTNDEDHDTETGIVLTSSDKSSTSVRRGGNVNSDAVKNGSVAHEAKIALPNAEAAFRFQKDIVNSDLGKYDLIENSCYSHVFDVLEAGGHPSIQRSKRGFFKFMKSNGFGRIADAPPLED